MILFDNGTPKLLADVVLNEHVISVTIAAYGFCIVMGDISIFCSERVYARLNGAMHEWDEGPRDGPWGLLVRQRVVDVGLVRQDLLRISFESGDHLDIETVEREQESVVIEFPPEGKTRVMEIY